MPTGAIEIEKLSKEYPFGFLHLKRKKSLEDLTMRVEDGEVFGFLGPNGAGKSTTIKLLMRLIFPSSGTARILRKYSKGMLQRVGLAQAILHDPQVVVLDEPMSGLDPLGRREVRDIILELKRQGRTVLFSTHVLSDAEMLCDRVGVIVGGKLRGIGAPDELVDIKAHGMEILFEMGGEPGNSALLAKATRTGNRYRVQLPEEELYAALEALKASGARILSVAQIKPTLEEYFMHLVEADRAQANAVDVSGK